MRRLIMAVVLCATLATVVGCAGTPLTTREKGTLLGGTLGAGGGALIGSAIGAPGAGAAIGGVAGAGTGYLLGNQIQNQQIRRYYGEY